MFKINNAKGITLHMTNTNYQHVLLLMFTANDDLGFHLVPYISRLLRFFVLQQLTRLNPLLSSLCRLWKIQEEGFFSYKYIMTIKNDFGNGLYTWS